jgi:hypothetical protein
MLYLCYYVFQLVTIRGARAPKLKGTFMDMQLYWRAFNYLGTAYILFFVVRGAYLKVKERFDVGSHFVAPVVVLIILALLILSIGAIVTGIQNSAKIDKDALAAGKKLGGNVAIGNSIGSDDVRMLNWRDGSHPQALWYNGELYIMETP